MKQTHSMLCHILITQTMWVTDKSAEVHQVGGKSFASTVCGFQLTIAHGKKTSEFTVSQVPD